MKYIFVSLFILILINGFIQGVIVFIRLFWLIGIAGALQTFLIVFLCSTCVCKNKRDN
jgi:hypothetical protein